VLLCITGSWWRRRSTTYYEQALTGLGGFSRVAVHCEAFIVPLCHCEVVLSTRLAHLGRVSRANSNTTCDSYVPPCWSGSVQRNDLAKVNLLRFCFTRTISSRSRVEALLALANTAALEDAGTQKRA